MWYRFRPYVNVAERRANAVRQMAARRKEGHDVSPVVIRGRKIATTFWGKAWCDNLESYGDFANRLPRGQRYVRNGSVVDLQIKKGGIAALVSGSDLYSVTIKIESIEKAHWKSIKKSCSGEIASLVELLQGKLSQGVMDIVTGPKGLFPEPQKIQMECSCPDWAVMCKHVAAVLYGIGSRLDHSPELLFQLRGVDHLELIDASMSAASMTMPKSSGAKTLSEEDLAGVFDIELVDSPISMQKSVARKKPAKAKPRAPRKPTASKTSKTASVRSRRRKSIAKADCATAGVIAKPRRRQAARTAE